MTALLLWSRCDGLSSLFWFGCRFTVKGIAVGTVVMELAKVCCDRGLLDELDWHVVLGGGGAAVFELGCCVEDFAVAGADLDADIAVGCGDGGVGAVEAGAAFVVDANAEGAGLAEEEVFESGDLCVIGKDGEEGAEASFFHLDGGAHDVEGAESEGALSYVGEDLRA
jgi:hypothetical protein